MRTISWTCVLLTAASLARADSSLEALKSRSFEPSIPMSSQLPEAPATPAATRVTPMLYAAAILQGDKNENISVVALNAMGTRAIIERNAKGGPFSSGATKIELMRRGLRGWSSRSLLRRTDAKWIGGMTLSALAFSYDGRFLIYSWMEDTADYKSTVIKVLDVNEGIETVLGAGRGGRVLEADLAATAKVVSESAWFKNAYPGFVYEEAFADTGRSCKGRGVRATVEGRRDLVVTNGAQSIVYPLKDLPGTSAWAWQAASLHHPMSADCTQGVIAVAEVQNSKSSSFFFGGDAYDAVMRLMEYGSIP